MKPSARILLSVALAAASLPRQASGWPTFNAPTTSTTDGGGSEPRTCIAYSNNTKGTSCGFNCRCAGRTGYVHTGLDIIADAGEAVSAPFEGTVREVSWHDAYGGVVVIESTDGTVSAGIGHLQCDLGCEDPETDACKAIDHTQKQDRPSARYCSSLQDPGGFNIYVGKHIKTGCSSTDMAECSLGKVGADDIQQNGG